MDQQENDGMKTYAELIEQGKQYSEYGSAITFEVYAQALELVDDKFEVYTLIAQAHIIKRNYYYVLEILVLASNFVNTQIDRYLAIASLYEQINFKGHALEIYGWIKDLDPQSNHLGPTTYEDYEQICQQLCQQQISNKKAADLFEIGSRILVEDISFQEQADFYFQKALENQQDKYDQLLQIGDIYYGQNLYQKSIQLYYDACKLRPEDFKSHFKFAESNLKLNLHQQALDYILSLKIPKDKDIYINLGLMFVGYEQTLDQGQDFILKGVYLSENQYETLLKLTEKLKGQQVNGILLQKAIELNGSDLGLATSYAQHMLITKNVSQQAIDAFKKYISLDPGDCFYINPLVKVYKELGRVDEAIDFLREFNKVSKRYNSFLELGELLLNEKKIDEALQSLIKAIELEKPHSYNFVVKVLFEKQYYEKCIQFCDEYTLFDHYSRSSYYYKAYSLIKLDKDLQTALDLLQKINYYYDTQDLIDIVQKRISEQQTQKDQEQQ